MFGILPTLINGSEHRRSLMSTDEKQVLRSLDHNLHGLPDDGPPLTLEQFNAVAIALLEKGLLGAQVETVHNDWTGRERTLVNAVWLTSEGRRVVGGL
jgi:hypothetical protein